MGTVSEKLEPHWLKLDVNILSLNRLNFYSEMALPKTILRLNNPFIGGLIIAALMSAVMSSADSILNSSTAIFVKDFYEEYLSKMHLNIRNTLLLARISSVFLGILGIILALLLPNVIDLLLLTYNLWAPGIILPVVLGVFTKTRTRNLNNLIFITMLLSTAATVLYMTTPFKEIIQPSVFGVIISCCIFFTGKSFGNRLLKKK